MQGLKMRPRPEPEKMPQQSAFLQRLYELRREGYGCEDIYVILKRERIPAPFEHIRKFVLRWPS